MKLKQCNSLISLGILFLFMFNQQVSAQKLEINHGPYLQYMTPNEVTVVWTTNVDCISWIEVYEEDGSSFYEKDRPRFFEASDGLKTIGRIHKITLTDLKPATRYVYRAYSKEVKDRFYRNPVYGGTVSTDPTNGRLLYFTTDKLIKDKTKCVVIADMHGNASKVGKLLEDVNWDEIDFVVSNGDYVSNLNSEDDLFDGGLDTCVDIFAKEIPYYAVRGNHETRGVMAHKLKNYFYCPQNKFYYTFSSGSTLFIILDGGEDKPDSALEYSGLVDFDTYRTEEAEWLKKVTESDKFKNAEHIIVFNHVPPFTKEKFWHGDAEVREKLVPILNNAGIDLMICGHTHRYSFQEKKSGVNNFPILTIDNKSRLDLSIDSSGINATVIDIDKKVQVELVFE
jgi:predicted phosphodiesterase